MQGSALDESAADEMTQGSRGDTCAVIDITEWGPSYAGVLSELVTASMPREQVSPDEVMACCWDDPGLVLGTPDGSAALSAVIRAGPEPGGSGLRGFVRLLAVHPGERRQGIGSALLALAESWLREQGAATVEMASSLPFYLWPGVDVHSMLAMQCLAESAGYRENGSVVMFSLPVTFRAPVPEGFDLRRTLGDADAARVGKLVSSEWPEVSGSVGRAIEQGTCLAVFDEGESGSRAVGVACHSVNRGGWVEPICVVPSCRGGGVGSALLSQVCTDLMVANYRDVQLPSVPSARFLARAGGAAGRVFGTSVKVLGSQQPERIRSRSAR